MRLDKLVYVFVQLALAHPGGFERGGMTTIILNTLYRSKDRPDLKRILYRNRVSKRVTAHTGNGAWG
jgi:hypothetical protein